MFGPWGDSWICEDSGFSSWEAEAPDFVSRLGGGVLGMTQGSSFGLGVIQAEGRNLGPPCPEEGFLEPRMVAALVLTGI